MNIQAEKCPLSFPFNFNLHSILIIISELPQIAVVPNKCGVQIPCIWKPLLRVTPASLTKSSFCLRRRYSSYGVQLPCVRNTCDQIHVVCRFRTYEIFIKGSSSFFDQSSFCLRCRYSSYGVQIPCIYCDMKYMWCTDTVHMKSFIKSSSSFFDQSGFCLRCRDTSQYARCWAHFNITS